MISAAGVEEEAAGVEDPAGLEEDAVGVEVLPAGVEVPASDVPGVVSVCEVAGVVSLSGALESPGFWHDASKSAAERIKTCERLFFIKILLFELPKESQSSGL